LVKDEAVLRGNPPEPPEIEGFSVLEASNGVDTLALLDVEKVDIIVSDIMMPGMDGYEFLKQVRGNSVLVNVPFIILTALAGRIEIRRGMGRDFYQGLGLGLYLSRAYVAHFGGQLNAYTDENADFVVDITFQEIENP
jgi:CheY-like chemotaxis protein